MRAFRQYQNWSPCIEISERNFCGYLRKEKIVETRLRFVGGGALTDSDNRLSPHKPRWRDYRHKWHQRTPRGHTAGMICDCPISNRWADRARWLRIRQTSSLEWLLSEPGTFHSERVEFIIYRIPWLRCKYSPQRRTRRLPSIRCFDPPNTQTNLWRKTFQNETIPTADWLSCRWVR